MLNHQQPPNWVLGRSKCNLRMTFEVLYQIIERDVAEANKIFEDRNFRHEQCNEGVRPIIYVSEIGTTEGRGVQFEVSTTSIYINGGGVQFFIRPNWDGKQCRMHINDEQQPLELWEISQRSLSNLFFPLPEIPL